MAKQYLKFTTWREMLPDGQVSSEVDIKNAALLAFREGRTPRAIAQCIRRHTKDQSYTEARIAKWFAEAVKR